MECGWPGVTVISPTIQEFNGERFYLCGHYFQHKGKRLHKTVWEYFNGFIPAGFHVHHRDENRANNNPDNLELKPAFKHLSDHAKERVDYNQRHIKEMQEQAKEWHGSEAGRAWHGEHAKRYWANAEEHEYTCTQCGKVFMTKHWYGKGQNHFCHPNCKAAYARAKRKGVVE